MARTVEPAQNPFERKPRERVAPWAGWYRGRGLWQKVVEAQTERDCWRLLLAYHDPRRSESDRCVLRVGVPPPPIRSREGGSE